MSYRFAAALVLFLAIAAIPLGWSQTYTVLYAFTGGADGALPVGGLIVDSNGNLYGTTHGNPGNPQSGTTAGSVFKLSPAGQFTLLHNFKKGGKEGGYPLAGLARDLAGNLYGTTGGGAGGVGSVFRIGKKGGFRVLYSFAGGTDGDGPTAPAVLDPEGNLYGTTLLGGHPRCDPGKPYRPCGAVFKVDNTGKETVLFHFSNPQTVGRMPWAGVIRDANGNLYGVASQMGAGMSGTVFRLSEKGSPAVLYSFNGQTESNPLSGLIMDGAGRLYGTTNGGSGTVYRIDPQGNQTTLYAFDGVSGAEPYFSGVSLDASGNLYGTTYGGGILPGCAVVSYNGCGVVYKLDTSGKQTVLYNFSGGTDGGNPESGVVLDSAGNLYGTAAYGGIVNGVCPLGCGVVFKITP